MPFLTCYADPSSSQQRALRSSPPSSFAQHLPMALLHRPNLSQRIQSLVFSRAMHPNPTTSSVLTSSQRVNVHLPHPSLDLACSTILPCPACLRNTSTTCQTFQKPFMHDITPPRRPHPAKERRAGVHASPAVGTDPFLPHPTVPEDSLLRPGWR
ncbi:hypothetical protein PMIN01_02209 [Paraphaeosphaeria minitans]|uniref:Uncharacterized protein n=1 Tax=Paraphaeosphaeria minitans TaxID=565426 RepID=A0A9P6GR20_9PLEO|nr:hypothetical protein PMIN01_02209 [Paraphaeosphaeria minitans]